MSNVDPMKERSTMECPTCGHTAVMWSTFVYGKYDNGVFLGTFKRTCWECSKCVKEGRQTYYHTEVELDILPNVVMVTLNQKRQTAKVPVHPALVRPEVTEAKPKAEVS